MRYRPAPCRQTRCRNATCRRRIQRLNPTSSRTMFERLFARRGDYLLFLHVQSDAAIPSIARTIQRSPTMQRSRVVWLLACGRKKQVSKNHSFIYGRLHQVKYAKEATIALQQIDSEQRLLCSVFAVNYILQHNCILQKNKARG